MYIFILTYIASITYRHNFNIVCQLKKNTFKLSRIANIFKKSERNHELLLKQFLSIANITGWISIHLFDQRPHIRKT